MERRFDGDGYVYDDSGKHISQTDDDYEFWKAEQDALVDPLSDNYCKYDNE